MLELVVATGNQGKVREIRRLFEATTVSIRSVTEWEPSFNPEESGKTYLDNARLKAVAAFQAINRPVVADDSGLCVVGLNLAPGVQSARYAGDAATDTDRVQYLLEQMGSISGPGRRAYFACTLYAILPTEKVGKTEDVAIFQNERFGHGLVGVSTEGRLWGSIGFTPSGEGGFGYDPVFHPDVDPKRTLAQFEMDEKNMISHRGVAFENLRKALSQGSGPR